MKEQNKLSLKEMQELFCDYAFNRLAEEDRKVFEQNLGEFPELQQELHEVNTVFKKVETLDLDKKISARTRNLSIKVNEQLAKGSMISRRRRMISKYLVPVLGIATIIIVIFSGNIKFSDPDVITNNTNSKVNENFTGITSAEAISLFDDDNEMIELASNLTNGLNPSTYDNLALFSDENLEESYNSTMDEFVKNSDLANIKGSYNLNTSTEYQFYNELENLEEEEFQKLLEELENADFNS